MATRKSTQLWTCKWGPCTHKFADEDEFTGHVYHAHISTATKVSRNEYNAIMQTPAIHTPERRTSTKFSTYNDQSSPQTPPSLSLPISPSINDMVNAALSSPAGHRNYHRPAKSPPNRHKRHRPNPAPPRARISAESTDSAQEIEDELTQPDPFEFEANSLPNAPAPAPATLAVPRFRSGKLHIVYPSSSQPEPRSGSQAEAAASTSLYSTYPRLSPNSHIPYSTLGESQGAPRWRERNSSLFDSTQGSQRGAGEKPEAQSAGLRPPRPTVAETQMQTQSQTLQLQTQAPYFSQTYSTDDSQ